MNLLDLYLFFARFVNADAIKRETLAEDVRGTAEYFKQAMNACVNQPQWVAINDASAYIISSDLKYVAQVMKNNDGKVVYIEIGKGDYNASTSETKLPIAITVCRHCNERNGSQLAQLAIQDECLNDIKHIISNTHQFISGPDSDCAISEMSQLAELQIFSPEAFFDNAGCVGYFELTFCN